VGKDQDHTPDEVEASSEEDASTEPAPKKKRRRKKRRKKRASSDKAAPSKKPDEASEPAAGRRVPWIALVILVIGVAELFVFGNRGRIEICVAKDDVHDFALLGTPRNDDNTKRYPTCEKRINVGMRSRYKEAKDDAVLHACRRANIFRGKKAILMCAIEAEGWKHRETTSYVPPWDETFRERLFWFAK
jgi:hypothetical protein